MALRSGHVKILQPNSLKCLRTIPRILVRELPQHCLFEGYQQAYLMDARVLTIQRQVHGSYSCRL